MRTPKHIDALRRVLSRTTVDHSTGCLLYTGSHSGHGRGGKYGRVSVGGVTHAVHILSFQVRHGRRVRPTKVLDHLCENRNCWNPDHLDEISNSINIKRIHRRRKVAPVGPPDLKWLFKLMGDEDYGEKPEIPEKPVLHSAGHEERGPADRGDIRDDRQGVHPGPGSKNEDRPL